MYRQSKVSDRERAERLGKTDSTQVVILTYPLSKERYSRVAIKAAGMEEGQKGKDNGLSLSFRKGTKRSGRVGRGLEGKLTDLMSQNNRLSQPRFNAATMTAALMRGYRPHGRHRGELKESPHVASRRGDHHNSYVAIWQMSTLDGSEI